MGVACLIWPIVMIGARERGIRGSRGTLPPTSSPCACALGTFMLEELPPLEKTAAKGRGKYMSADLDRPVFGGRIPTRWYLAIALQISSTITAMGAGMTVKFFPLFFKARRSPDRVHTSLLAGPVAACLSQVDYGFTPQALCLLTFACPIAMAVMQRVCLRVSNSLGRLPAIMLFHFLGTAALVVMCLCDNVAALVFLFIIRGALMNARSPIITAVTMDLVTTEMRGRWASIQSITGFSWSGSAFIGGVIAQAYGYRFSFFVTAIVYMVSFALMFPIMWAFPKEQDTTVEEAISMVRQSHAPSRPFSVVLNDAGSYLPDDPEAKKKAPVGP